MIPPRGVRVVLADGAEVNVDHTLRYRGVSTDGLHQWTALLPADVELHEVRELLVDALPGRTQVRMTNEAT